jgi:DNA processing protein
MNTKISSQEVILLLSHHPKIGSQTIKKLHYLCDGDISRVFNLEIDKLNLINKNLSNFLSEVKNYSPERIKGVLKEKDIGYVTYLDTNYPGRLSEAKDCPAILFVKGDIESLDRESIAVVGSRKYSDYGARVCRRIVSHISAGPLTVVSGLALGIDSIAHQTTLENNGITIAVLGCGLDVVYPVSNIPLAKAIVNGGGAIISEYPPKTEPFKSNFPARNRIIAALSLGTLVVEAAKHSGAIITAMSALDYNREVFAIPGPIDSPYSEGCNYLIQQGAKLVMDSDDILNELNIEQLDNIKKAKKELKHNKEERVILEIVQGEGMSCDEICRISGLNIAAVSQTLTMLEMKGILENVGGIWREK